MTLKKWHQLKWFYSTKGREALHEELLYALLLHAQTKNWRGIVDVEGRTCVQKLDSTTGNTVVYRSDTFFLWVISHTLGTVQIWGRQKSGWQSQCGNDTWFCAVHRNQRSKSRATCCGSVFAGISKCWRWKIITDVTLITGIKSIYFVSVKDLIGPLCVVPNIRNLFRTNQDVESWLAIMPRRKWGRHFGNNIDW